ncbi:MAG: Ig-like domain-containing protein [Capnocytophaga felis]|nr:Ig-like domain-containing protein [Capnocytophaga felis]
MIKEVHQLAVRQEKMSLRKAFRLVIVMIIGLMTLVGCKKDEPETISVTEIKLSEATLNLIEEGEKALTATVLPENATDKAIAWKSSNTEVATVENGKVKALKAGKATITAQSANGKTAKCEVIVTPKTIEVSEISLNKVTLTLIEGDSETLTANILPADATNKTLTWTSSNTEVATVENGKVMAIKAGTATITAQSANGKTAKCELTINPRTISVTGIALNKSEITLTKGNAEDLVATVTPDNATNKNVIWSSDKTNVATVTNGKITAVSAGTAVITARSEDGNHTATCSVTVNENESGSKYKFSANVSILADGQSVTEKVMNVGQTVSVSLTNVSAENANKIRWIIEPDEGTVSVKKDAANPLTITIEALQSGEVDVMAVDETYDENSEEETDSERSFIIIIE